MSCVKNESAQTAEKGHKGLDFNPYDMMEPRKPGKTPQRPAEWRFREVT